MAIPVLQKKRELAAADPREAHALSSAKIVALDIETANATKEETEREVARRMERWEPPANYKDPEKIAAKKAEAEEKIRQRSALLDVSPIACVAVRTEKVGLVFNGLDEKEYVVNHSTVISCGTERRMLVALREWLDASSNEETILVGFNILSFDLPRLRGAYARHRLRLPLVLAPRVLEDERQPAVDVMRLFLSWFTSQNHGDRMISLDEVTERLGLPKYKDQVDGSKIPQLIADGKIAEVLTYCAVDTMTPLAAYLLMTSKADGLE